MKIFEFYNFEYPDEMWEIIHYLEQRGNINVSYTELEELYMDFIYDVYRAQWMMVSNETLKGFSEYLTDIEVNNENTIYLQWT